MRQVYGSRKELLCSYMGLATPTPLYVELYTMLIARMDPLQSLFEKPALTGRTARWQMWLSEFDIVYVTQKAIKEQGVADHLASHPLPDYEGMQTNLPDEAILFSVGEEED